MSEINATTPELWPINAKAILEEKNVNIRELKRSYECISFP